jgi:hypothetical protein
MKRPARSYANYVAIIEEVRTSWWSIRAYQCVIDIGSVTWLAILAINQGWVFSHVILIIDDRIETEVYPRYNVALNKWETEKRIRIIIVERYLYPYQVFSSRPMKISLPGKIGIGSIRTLLELIHNHKSAWLTVKHITLCALGCKDSNTTDHCAVHFHIMDTTWFRHVSDHWLVRISSRDE